MMVTTLVPRGARGGSLTVAARVTEDILSAEQEQEGLDER